MKPLLIQVLMFFSFQGFAESFRINGGWLEFADKEGILYYNCPKECLALSAVKMHPKIDIDLVRSKIQNPGSIGSDVCSPVYGGGSVLGIAQNKDGRAFCVFKDSSIIEINSLSSYLVNKGIVKSRQ